MDDATPGVGTRTFLDALNAALSIVPTAPGERDAEANATMQRALSIRGDLLGLLAHPDRAVRVRAARAVSMLDGPEAVGALLAALPRELDGLVRATIYVGFALQRPEEERAAIEAAPFPDLDEEDVAGFAARTTQAVLLRERLPAARRARLLGDVPKVLSIDPELRETTWITSGVDALGAALNAVGMGPQDGPRLAERFTDLRSPEQMGSVAMAIWLAIDDSPTRQELLSVLDSVCAHDHLWTEDMAPSLRGVLATFGLPERRDELRGALADFRAD